MTDEPQVQLNTRAIEIAGQAMGRIASHEDACTRRQTEILTRFDEGRADRAQLATDLKGMIADLKTEFTDQIDGIKSVLGRCAWAMAGGGVSMLLYLIVTYVLPHPVLSTPAVAGMFHGG